MSDTAHLRDIVAAWARAVAAGDSAGILARHADDVVMFDFPDTVRGIEAYARTWDFFDESRRGAVTFAQATLRSRQATGQASHCARFTAKGRPPDRSISA